MTSIDSNKVTNVEVKNENDISTSEVMQTNNDRNLNISTVAKVDEETVVSSDLFAYDPAKYSFCKQNSIVSTLKVGDSGTLEFQEEIRKGVFGITLWPESAASDYEKLLDQYAIVIPEATQWQNRRPNIGDLAYGQKLNGHWIRGYVVTLLPYLNMAMVDEARVVLVINLATCKPPLSDLYAFGGLCELTDTTYKLEEGEEYKFKVTGQTDNEEEDGFEILIHKGDYELKGTVKPWIPTPEQVGVPCGEVTNGCEVCVTAYQSHTVIYVRPLDTLGLARYNFIMETLAKCAETSPFVKVPNVEDLIGMEVLAPLAADGKYYRAHVIFAEEYKEEDEDGNRDIVEVLYYDLGRREFVDKEKLKILPHSVAELGSFLSKVILQDVPGNIPPLQEIVDILDNLVETKVPLICTFDGIPATDGVYLKYPDGESLNNMICKCIEPDGVKPSE